MPTIRTTLSLTVTALACALALPRSAAAQKNLGMVLSLPEAPTLMSLVRRPEVQNELKLDLKQRNALEEAAPSKTPITIKATASSHDPNADQSSDIKRQIDDQMAALRDGMEGKLKAILRPEQMKRLHELDLQWRGALALAEDRTAKEVELTPPHHSEIAKIAEQYQAERQQIMQALIEKNAQVEENSDGANTFKAIRIGKMPDLSNPLDPDVQKMNALKKSAEKKILAVLNEEEAARWKAVQGTPFTFRTDQPGIRR